MKIIKNTGKDPSKPWVGRKLECRNCGTIFQLEGDDPVRRIQDFRDGDFFSIACPNTACGADVTFT